MTAVALSVIALAAAPPPSSGRCAGAWNRHPVAAVLAVVRRLHVWQATVAETTLDTGKVSMSSSGVTSSTTSGGPGCVVVFLLPNGSVSLLAGWRNGTVMHWSTPLRRAAPRGGGGNACVARDGTIHHVGPYTAASRCPRR